MGSITKIRNIVQSAQEREIIKTAPDMVVYIESLPFVINPYLKQGKSDTVVVNFNDFITTINMSYSIDSFIPSGTIMLSVPNGFKHLFMAPGGNIIFDIMTSVRIYTKSYFYSEKGNSVYRRTFNGLIKAINLNETPTGLEISLTIAGICRLLEIIQMETKKSLMSNSELQVTWARTNQKDMSVYEAIYDCFDHDMDFSEFLTTSLKQDAVDAKGDLGKAIKQQYQARWTLRLQDLRSDLRIFGAGNEKALTTPKTKTPPDHKTEDRVKGGKTRVPLKKESASYQDNKAVVERLKGYHFDMAIGGIQLMGGQLVPRIERVRQLVEMAGMEGYQDVDGLIIVKPPLYNLDVTVLGDKNTGGSDFEDENLYETANPYIIHMAEIMSEDYVEDETAVRRTSMTLAPNFGNPGELQIENHMDKTQVVRYADINLIRKFGVREEQPKYFGFLTEDKMANYAFAVCELNKANRNWKTYHLTIPLRPELRLGFPIFVPHRDMYAYITGIAISYAVGGTATMSLTCNYIRKRPLLEQEQTIVTEQPGPPDPKQGPPTSTTSVTVYASQPNLVHAWTTKGATGPVKSGMDQNGKSLKQTGDPSTIGSKANDEKPTDNEMAVINHKRKKMGQIFETWVDNFDGACWRVQVDDGSLALKHSGGSVETNQCWYNGDLDPDTGERKTRKIADLNYLRRGTVVQPYTDEKGYEVIPLLPWGRYSTLREALVDCTRNYWYQGAAAKKEEVQKLVRKTSGFLMAGLAVPGATPSAVLQRNLKAAQSQKQLADNQAAVLAAASSGGPFGAAAAAAGVGLQANAQAGVDQAQQAANSDPNMLSNAIGNLEKFDKSNLVSFELDFSNDQLGDPRDRIPDRAIPVDINQTDLQNDARQMFDQLRGGAVSSESWQEKMTSFLYGFLGPTQSSQNGPYAVDTRPQNTDIGGYRPPSGPFSGVLLSMAATFTSSPYGDIFGLRPPKKSAGSYFVSGYEDRRNIG